MVKKLFAKINKGTLSFALMAMMMLASAVPSFAANADLDATTQNLVTGAGDMKTNFLTLIAIIIAIIVVVFGIGWLIKLFIRNMNKA